MASDTESELDDGSSATLSPQTLHRLLNLADRIEIQEVICGETMMGDLLDPSVATEQFYTADATVAFGRVGDPERVPIPISEYKKWIESYLPGFDARQHQMTNFLINVDGDSAESRCQVSTQVSLGEDVYHSYGMYYHTLVRTPQGWRIHRQETDMRINIGNLEKMVALATERTKANPPS